MVNECTGSHRVCSCHAWTPTIVGAYTKAPDRGDIPQHVSQEEDTVWGRVPSGAIGRKMWRAGPCDTICARFQQGSHECHRGRETFVLECSWCMYAEAAEVALR